MASAVVGSATDCASCRSFSSFSPVGNRVGRIERLCRPARSLPASLPAPEPARRRTSESWLRIASTIRFIDDLLRGTGIRYPVSVYSGPVHLCTRQPLYLCTRALLHSCLLPSALCTSALCLRAPPPPSGCRASPAAWRSAACAAWCPPGRRLDRVAGGGAQFPELAHRHHHARVVGADRLVVGAHRGVQPRAQRASNRSVNDRARS